MAEIKYFSILDNAKTEDDYLNAIKLCPDRLDAIYKLSIFCYANGNYEHAYEYAKIGIMLNIPTKYTLNFDISLYEWQMQLHFIKMAYYYGSYQEAINVGIQLLKSNKLPQEHVENVISDIKWCTDKLQKQELKKEIKTGKIAFVSKKTKNLEIIGPLALVFKTQSIDVYVNSVDYFSVYKKLCSNIRKADLNRLESNFYLYDYVFLFNPDDLDTMSAHIIKQYQSKIILIGANLTEMRSGYKALSLSPLINRYINTEFFLPIYKGNGDINFKKETIITTFIEDNFINEYKKGYILNIITDDLRLRGKYSNVNVLPNVDTRRKLDIVSKSKFMIGHNCETICLAYNYNIPLITSLEVSNLFKLNCTTYDKSMSEIINKILEMTDLEYLDLVKQMVEQKHRLCLENERRILLFLD